MKRLLSSLITCLALSSTGVSAANYEASEMFVFKGGTPSDWLNINNAWYLNTLDGSAAQFKGSDSIPGLYSFGTNSIANGNLVMNPEAGLLVTDTVSGLGLTTSGFSLHTNIDAANLSGGLSISQTFLAGAGFVPSVPAANQAYGIRLADNFSNSSDIISLVVASDDSGNSSLVFQKTGNTAGSTAVLANFPIANIPANSTLLLALAHETAGSKSIGAYYGLYDTASGSCLLAGCMVSLGAVATAFDGENFTRLQVLSVSAVPEPASWAIMSSGLILLLGATRRRHKQ